MDSGGYIIEHAKSGRTACKKCSENISKDTLRWGSMSGSDSMYARTFWYHLECVTVKMWHNAGRHYGVDEGYKKIQGFPQLPQDQQMIVKALWKKKQGEEEAPPASRKPTKKMIAAAAAAAEAAAALAATVDSQTSGNEEGEEEIEPVKVQKEVQKKVGKKRKVKGGRDDDY